MMCSPFLETHPPSWLVPFFWKPRATPTSHWYHSQGGGANRGLSSIFKVKNFMGNNKWILTLFAIYVLLNLLPQTIFIRASSDLWWGDFSTNWWQRVIFNLSDFVYLFFSPWWKLRVVWSWAPGSVRTVETITWPRWRQSSHFHEIPTSIILGVWGNNPEWRMDGRVWCSVWGRYLRFLSTSPLLFFWLF